MSIKKLGPYELGEVLGRGGMGTVYRAKHAANGQVYAVKVLAPYYANDSHFRRRFESEIQALIKLDHPNIVRLIGFGQEDANLFFAMELVEGRSLFQLQRDGIQFDWRDVLFIAREVAQGLRHAHDRGVIHRDLKPGNLLKSVQGEIKITDFGIAKNFGASANTGSNVLGTMDFMSPEQAKGQPVTVRSDLYSLGTVMYCLLAGRPPFTGNSVEETIRNLTSVPAPRVRHTAPEVPAELDQVIAHLLEKRPEDRVPTALALIHQLEAVEETLRGVSEATTMDRPPEPSHETFDLAAPRTTDTGVAPPEVDKDQPTETPAGTSDEAMPVTDPSTKAEHEPTARQDSGAQIDYFATVTDQLREKQFASAKGPDSFSWRGMLTIAVPLLLIIGFASWAYYQSVRTPPADTLYAVIAENEQRPHRVRDEMETFLAAYPDDPRVPQIRQWMELADAIALFNRLSVQLRSMANPNLSELERRFVKTIQLANDDPPMAYKQLKALITLHQDNPEMTMRETRCVEAGRAYLQKLKRDAEKQRLIGAEQIRLAMDRAAKAEPEDARRIYQSIIDLYGNTSWAKPLVDEARQKMEQR